MAEQTLTVGNATLLATEIPPVTRSFTTNGTSTFPTDQSGYPRSSNDDLDRVILLRSLEIWMHPRLD
jgi:hypothetical protein